MLVVSIHIFLPQSQQKQNNKNDNNAIVSCCCFNTGKILKTIEE